MHGTRRAITDLKIKTFNLARDFYNQFRTQLDWSLDVPDQPKYNAANQWLRAAQWYAPGVRNFCGTDAEIIRKVHESLRYRARENTLAWKWYEAHREELEMFETGALLLGPNAPNI